MITATDLSKDYGKLKALDKVNLSFNKGACIAFIGPNGSGKTTLLKCILGMVVPSGGSISFNNVNITNAYLYRNQIGYMPQIGNYPKNMSIGQVIGMMKDIREDISSELDEELIEKFELTKILEKRMGTLSGGTRQKVSACLAFLFNAQVLILDEPTAGLDPLSSELLKAKIIKEKLKGKLIIITSHVLSELDDLITEVVYMQEGRIRFHIGIEALQSNTGEEKLTKAIASIMLKNKL